MKKIVKILAAVLAAISLIVLIIIYVCLNSVTKSAVESTAPRMTQTTFKVNSVSLSPFSGAGVLSGIVAGNPEGFKSPQSIAAKGVRVNLALSSVFSDLLVIEEVVIDAPDITYEVGLGGSNIDRILKNINEFIGQEKSTRKVIIQDFWLKGGKLTISNSLITDLACSVPIPDVHLTDIGKKSNGATLAEALTEIMKPVSASVTSASGSLIKACKNPGAILKMGSDNMKGLFGK